VQNSLQAKTTFIDIVATVYLKHGFRIL
jgi:hypothetical protein